MVTFETEFSICLKQVGKHVLCLIRKRDRSLSISFFVSFQTKYHITYEQTQMTWSYTASTHPSHERNRHPPYSACLLPFFLQNNRNRVSIPGMPHPNYLSKSLSESLFSSLYTHRNHPSFKILRKTTIHKCDHCVHS